jgi:uncharacterized LabA/DUF88 family protein
MNQQSPEITAPTGAEETPSAQPGRRRRGSGRRRSPARQVETPAVEAAVSAPEAEAPAPAAEAQAQPAEEQPSPAAKTTPSRSRGRRGGTRRRGADHEASAGAEAAAVEPAPEVGAPGEPVATLPIPASEEAPAAIPAQTDAAAAAVADFVASITGGTPPQIAAAEPDETPLVPTLTAPAQPEAEAAPATNAAPTAPAAEPAPSARRYRFDRPARATTTGTTAPFARPERLSGPRSAVTSQDEAAPEAAAPEATAEPPAPLLVPEPMAPEQAESTLQEPVSIELPQASEAAPTEATEDTATAESAAEASAEAEAASARRRRRRRRGGGGLRTADGAESEGEEETSAPPRAAASRRAASAGAYADLAVPEPLAEPPAHEAENGYGPYEDYEQPYAPYMPAARERAAQPSGQPWNIGSAYQQMNQPTSPFAAPEPSFARGFGPQPSGVAGPAREVYPRTGRPARGIDAPPMSANQLGQVITQAISRQTDRLLTELRHQQQAPSMTVMLPSSVSTERVGVFVDVANLLYSARSLRVGVDFGHLLDFLRGNRRLVRAHAYAPTNPEPQAEQQFLSVVKGLGYRITTKNYKTFASGAKKADLDLDLCMDIVRLVEANAVDTVVLVSGDSDFLPLLEYCSDHGVRVEVAAFEDAAAQILRQSCDLFINLSMVDEIRA